MKYVELFSSFVFTGLKRENPDEDGIVGAGDKAKVYIPYFTACNILKNIINYGFPSS